MGFKRITILVGIKMKEKFQMNCLKNKIKMNDLINRFIMAYNENPEKVTKFINKIKAS